MLIKDLIQKLQDIYDNEIQGDYLDIMGEPEIMIDIFESDNNNNKHFVYKGFDKEIDIERSSDGIYLILSRFKAEEK